MVLLLKKEPSIRHENWCQSKFDFKIWTLLYRHEKWHGNEFGFRKMNLVLYGGKIDAEINLKMRIWTLCDGGKIDLKINSVLVKWTLSWILKIRLSHFPSNNAPLFNSCCLNPLQSLRFSNILGVLYIFPITKFS